MRRLVIGGDVCPINRHVEPLAGGSAAEILKGFAGYLRDADLRVVNLECPLVDRLEPIPKSGPALAAPTACVEGLARLPVDVVGLANNHVMDQGVDGLRSTMAALERAGLRAFGAGENLVEAGRVLVVGDSLRFGFLGLAGREFSIASPATPGCYPADPISAETAIRRSRADWDLLVVFLHEGPNLFPYPRPGLRRKAQWLVELGATIVVCQHSHCAGSVEEYGKGLIVYGQGNLLFDWIPDVGVAWNEGFLLGIDCGPAGVEGWDLFSYARDPDTGVVAALEGERRAHFLNQLALRREETMSDECLAARWRGYCRAQRDEYAGLLMGRPGYARIRRILRERLSLGWAPWAKEHQRILGNLFRCEDHRELLETLFVECDEE